MIPETKIAARSANGYSTDDVVFTLRISRELNEKLVAEATAQKRSRQGHIVYLLEKASEQAEEKK